MVLNISESGVLLESSAKATAELPAQAFAITLSESVIEDMIACVQNGGDIQLALGSSPKFLFDDHELQIPKNSDPSGYDLFWSSSNNSSTASRLPEPTMSILKYPSQHRPKFKTTKASKPAGKGEPAAKKAPPKASTKSNATSSTTPRPGSASNRDSDSQRGPDDAAAQLERSFANLAADKRENSAVIVGSFPSGLVSGKPGKYSASKLISAQAAPSPRSLPPSPALSGIGSPSLASSGNTAQERLKQQRFPILHELAVQDLSRADIFDKWNEGSEDEFETALNKVADLDKGSNKWALKRNSWKELDVFAYNYEHDEDRQKAITNAIRQYDRLRISASDPLWQKLLPKADRGKGICLSKLQATLAKGPAVPKQKADTASISGGDSEKDDGSVLKGGKGGEAMSRSSSQTSTGKKKLSASELQAKRLLSNKKKPAAASTAKATPKSSAPKSSAKSAPAKGGRVLSKEFVSDSSSSDDEVPLSSSKGKPKTAAAAVPRPAQRVAEKPRIAEKIKETPPLKPKPAAMTKAPLREEKREREKDTIRAEVIAKPIKPAAKRARNVDDDDSSSSGTPLSKRVKPVNKPLPAPTSSAKARTASDASQHSRGASGSGVAVPKAKNTSPAKSSPLALSPPTNASDMEQERRARERQRERERERARERQRDRDTAVRSSSGSTTDSSSSVVNMGGASTSKKRPPPPSDSSSRNDSSNGNGRPAKRQRPSQETIEMAERFRKFYARYQQLHHDVAALENPDPGQVTDLIDMHERLSRMKTEIYASVEA